MSSRSETEKRRSMAHLSKQKCGAQTRCSVNCLMPAVYKVMYWRPLDVYILCHGAIELLCSPLICACKKAFRHQLQPWLSCFGILDMFVQTRKLLFRRSVWVLLHSQVMSGISAKNLYWILFLAVNDNVLLILNSSTKLMFCCIWNFISWNIF